MTRRSGSYRLALAVPSRLVLILVILGTATPAGAQAPGYQQIDVGSIRAEYNAEVLTRINEHLADWGEAWANDRVEELSELYWEDALLIAPDGVMRRGLNDIRDYFSSALGDHGTVEAFMLDFDASGGMAQVFGNYMLAIQGGEATGTERRGPMMTVYRLRGRTWKIRSQIFLPPV
ncbi:MAG: nuclear transport factor 2 family protein [Longimicrobiales bacterium]|nr:nuclear transport factor 2 family protein [Longimicrobiales bacterium]